jgi:hypothetical protein
VAVRHDAATVIPASRSRCGSRRGRLTAAKTRLALAVLLALGLAACSDGDERRCHLAVKSLVAAPQSKVAGELDKVVAFGRYALVDIEQEYHAASGSGRRRLLDALDRLRLAEAQPFVEQIARGETDPTVREQAARLARRAPR